jgi:hypothetical protein
VWRRLADDGEPAVEAGTGSAPRGWVGELRGDAPSLGMVRNSQRGARAGCLRRLDDDEHGGVQSSTGGVKQRMRKKKGVFHSGVLPL